jgi:hypothetical protein
MREVKKSNLREWYNRACCLLYVNEGYKPPTPEEVRYLQRLNGWSQIDMAKLVGVSFNEKSGSTTIRKWCSPLNSKEHRAIPYSAWRLLLSYSFLNINVNEGLKITGKKLLETVNDSV